jgi:hypothetical protein
MPGYRIIEEEPGIAGYVIFTLNKQHDRRTALNIINRPDKDPLPERPPEFLPKEKVEIPGLGRDNTVVGPSKRPGETMIKHGDMGPYSIPTRVLHRRRPNRKPNRHLVPAIPVDINYSRRFNIW